MATIKLVDGLESIYRAVAYARSITSQIADSPPLLQQLRNRLRQVDETISAVRSSLAEKNSGLQTRTSLIAIDDFGIILTQLIVVLSELQPFIEALKDKTSLLTSFEWPEVDIDVQKPAEGLDTWDCILNLASLTIQSEWLFEAKCSAAQLHKSIQLRVRSNHDLAKRWTQLREDVRSWYRTDIEKTDCMFDMEDDDVAEAKTLVDENVDNEKLSGGLSDDEFVVLDNEDSASCYSMLTDYTIQSYLDTDSVYFAPRRNQDNELVLGSDTEPDSTSTSEIVDLQAIPWGLDRLAEAATIKLPLNKIEQSRFSQLLKTPVNRLAPVRGPPRKRLLRELDSLINVPIPGCKVELIDDDLSSWSIKFARPENICIRDEILELRLGFPAEYPFKLPQLHFVTVFRHPNIRTNGTVDTDSFRRFWNPAMTVESVILSVYWLLRNPVYDNVCDSCSKVANSWSQCKRDRYNVTVKEWKRRFAG